MSTIDSILNTPSPRQKAETFADLKKKFVRNCVEKRNLAEAQFIRICGPSSEAPEPADQQPSEKVTFIEEEHATERLRGFENDLPVLEDLLKRSLNDFEAQESESQGKFTFAMKSFLQKGFSVLDLVTDQGLRELFGILCAKYVELCAGSVINPRLIRNILGCLRTWLDDYIKDLELQSLSLVDMVNKELNLTLFFDNSNAIRDAIVEMSDTDAKANLQRALVVVENISSLKDLTEQIPKQLERYVFVPTETDSGLIDQIFSSYRSENVEFIKTWICSDIKARSASLSLARSRAIANARKVWDEHLLDSERVKFRKLVSLLDEYLAVAENYDEKFAIHMEYIFTLLSMNVKLSCQLPSVELFSERLGMTVLCEKKVEAHCALELLEQYQSLAKTNVVTEWKSTDVSRNVLNALVCVARFQNWSEDVLERFLNVSFGDDALSCIPFVPTENAIDSYFQLREYLLYIFNEVKDEDTKSSCMKLRASLSHIFEKGTKDFAAFFSLWRSIDTETDVYLGNFKEVHELVSLLQAFHVLCKCFGKDDFRGRIRGLLTLETLRSINAKLMFLSKPEVIEVPKFQFFSDEIKDTGEQWRLFHVFWDHFSGISTEDIYGKPPTNSESYVLGLCRLELNNLQAMFIEDGHSKITFTEVHPKLHRQEKTGRAMNVFGNFQKFSKDLDAVIRSHPKEDMPTLKSESEKLQHKLEMILPRKAFDELRQTKTRYEETRKIWTEVRSEYMKMLKLAGDAKTERKWHEKTSAILQENMDYEMSCRQDAIDRAREDMVRISRRKGCVVSDPENPEDVQRAERLLEIRKMTCLSSIAKLHDKVDEQVQAIRDDTKSVIESIRADWNKIRKSDRSVFEEALRLVQAINTDNGGTADEEEAISLMMADTEKQVEVLSQMLSFEKGETQRHENAVQFISLHPRQKTSCNPHARPRTSCNRARLDETRAMSRAVLDQLLERRQELIDREAELLQRLRE